MDDTQNQVDIINTTDCLEAVSAFKGAKNFLFMVAFICLLLIQAVFWLDFAGLIDKSDPCDKCLQACAKAGVCITLQEKADESDTIAAQAAIAVADAEKGVKLPKPDKPLVDQTPSTETTETTATKPDQASAEIAPGKFKYLQPSCRQIACLIKCCNFILIITVFLYCVTLFMSIHISLVGRLGGVNHISRAFLQSLFAMAFLFPWQCCLPNVVYGAMYMPAELLCRQCTAGSMLMTILCYLRFTGLWVIVLLLLIFAQFRSIRWARATLRRLGMAH